MFWLFAGGGEVDIIYSVHASFPDLLIEQNSKELFHFLQLQYWKASEGRSEMKEVDIYVSRNSNERGDHRHHRSHHRGQDIRATVTNLPAYTAMRAQVCVMNTHFVGHPSNIANFHTPEGSK